MKISIVNKFIAVGLVMLAVGATCSSASPVLPRAFGGDYGRMVQKRLSDIEQITNAPFYPTTEDRESLILASKSPVLLMVAISRAHNASGGSTINAVNGDLSATKSVAVSIFPDLTTIIPGKNITPEQVTEFVDKMEKAGVDLSNPKVSIGTWFDADAGQTYLDVTATLPDRSKAVELGQKFNQKAVFDLSNFETIETGGTGEAEAPMPSIKERMDTIILSSANSRGRWHSRRGWHESRKHSRDGMGISTRLTQITGFQLAKHASAPDVWQAGGRPRPSAFLPDFVPESSRRSRAT
jgi:hypothetical protein